MHQRATSHDAAHYINFFDLTPHPEGGYYKRTFASSTEVQTADSRIRHALTSIYYLLDRDDFSAWHQLNADEMWFHHAGSAVQIHMITSNGALETQMIGEQQCQIAIPANTWFAAENMDKTQFSFCSCAVAPGFEFTDFKLAQREELFQQFPLLEKEIRQFTRQP